MLYAAPLKILKVGIKSRASHILGKWVSLEGDEQLGLELCPRTPVEPKNIQPIQTLGLFCPNP